MKMNFKYGINALKWIKKYLETLIITNLII